jgi:O-antigen/teichoic acid export membrane protein
MTTLKKRAIRGAIWTLFGYGSAQILRFGSNLVLTRLLVPEFFGLMAVVNTLRAGIDLFSDLGIPQSIVNNKRGEEPTFLNTAWTLQAIRGWILWLFFLLIPSLLQSSTMTSALLLLIPIVGLTSVFDGFSSTSIHTLHRRIDLGKMTRIRDDGANLNSVYHDSRCLVKSKCLGFSYWRSRRRNI